MLFDTQQMDRTKLNLRHKVCIMHSDCFPFDQKNTMKYQIVWKIPMVIAEVLEKGPTQGIPKLFELFY